MEVVIGSAHPLHAGASSKAFLAFLGTDEARSYLARNELARLTDRTVTDSAKLLRELAGVRRRGYAVSIGERQAGAASVASPVFDHEGSAVAVVSVCGPAERLKPSVAECTDALLTATKRLSSRLGFAPTS
jgi:DNA-binding IclR family transcriptional regulator